MSLKIYPQKMSKASFRFLFYFKNKIYLHMFDILMEKSTTNASDFQHFAAIRNIPQSFHSADLRNYFSQLIEEKGFTCFHFKHRPEVVKEKTSHSQPDSVPAAETCVCVVALTDLQSLNKLTCMYNAKNWVNKKGEYLAAKCVIINLAVQQDEMQSKGYMTQKERAYYKRHAQVEKFSANDLMNMSELRPPVHVMPNGNVGTPIPVFLDLIKNCVLPASIIKKLGLVFPKTASHRRYGNVPFVYEEGWTQTFETFQTEETALTADGCEILSADEKELPTSSKSRETEHTLNDIKDSSESDDDDCEEWERHEAFQSDPTNQGRENERLFEEKIELKWEKGGSGLVFYTDAQHWAAQDGDFDEQTTDQWDVDMNEFYGEDGDRDAKDFVNICREKRLQNGEKLLYHNKTKRAKEKNRLSKNHKYHSSSKLGDFEKHTRGIGRKLMEKYGWVENGPLGSSKQSGITEPIEAEGQTSHEKSGIGYHGEKRTPAILEVGKEYVSKSRKVNADSEAAISKGRKLARGQNARRDPALEFPSTGFMSTSAKHRIVEPLASHSWNFPQFRSNLVSLSSLHQPFSKATRKTAVPGRDGIVITTKYDQPLDVDLDSGILRSSHPTALKRNRTKSGDEGSTKTRSSGGTKLVKAPAKEPLLALCVSATSSRSYSFTPTMQFVRPLNESEWIISSQT